MYKISIEDIENAKNKIYHFDFDDVIPEIEARVKAELDLISLGDFIEVQGKVTGNIKLECDVCLSPFVQDLDIEINEMYAKTSLYSEYGGEVELRGDQFVTDLNGANV